MHDFSHGSELMFRPLAGVSPVFPRWRIRSSLRSEQVMSETRRTEGKNSLKWTFPFKHVGNRGQRKQTLNELYRSLSVDYGRVTFWPLLRNVTTSACHVTLDVSHLRLDGSPAHVFVPSLVSRQIA